MTAPALPSYCLIGEKSVSTWYEALLENKTIAADARQAEAIHLLQQFADELTAAKQADDSGGWIHNIRSLWKGKGAPPPQQDAGIYLHGGVGRGKSFLMDAFYLQLPLERKLRVHFHQFMRRLHADMKKNENQRDSLQIAANALAARFDLICFDEFHVSDITDAMLLGRLLEILLAAGTRFVMTSNYPPPGLYPNGLARDRFLPTIALLESRLRLFALDGGRDYRLLRSSGYPAYYSPSDDKAKRTLRELFDRFACGISLQNKIKLNGRTVNAVARASDCIWFDFAALCREARSKEDYLDIAHRFGAVLLSDVPRLDSSLFADAARRFTWLVDILYDRRVKLIIAAAAPLEALYGDGEGGESGRTLSRLYEMQHDDYAAARNMPLSAV